MEFESFHAFRVTTDLGSSPFVVYRLLTQSLPPPLDSRDEIRTPVGVSAWILLHADLTAARSTIELLWSGKELHTQRLEYIRFEIESQEDQEKLSK